MFASADSLTHDLIQYSFICTAPEHKNKAPQGTSQCVHTVDALHLKLKPPEFNLHVQCVNVAAVLV